MSKGIDEAEVEVAMEAVCDCHDSLKPPRRVTVTEGARQVFIVSSPGQASAPYSPSETPYMREPMDALSSRRTEGVVFVGPARTGKTLGLLEGALAHFIVHDAGDTLVVHMSQDKAREYSKTRIDRMIRHSPEIKALMSPSKMDDNAHDKTFRNGMWLRIGWPTVANLSGSDYRYVMLTDYDRMPEDIGGEGAAWGLALKRTQTFGTRGMCLAESSPGFPIVDPHWMPLTAHQAPPVGGILSIYNMSDRRRWYWKCVECKDWFEAKPGLGLFNLPEMEQLTEIALKEDIEAFADKYSRVVCPHCACEIGPQWKNQMNAGGIWVPDNASIVGDTVMGEPIRSPLKGYWLGGVAARYQKWQSLISRYMNGLRIYALTGTEESLKNTVNTDQGMPYLSQHLEQTRAASTKPMERTEAALGRYIVPDAARFLIAAVDVQGGANARFIVQVHAVGEFLEQWLVDRFEIKDSERPGMGTEFAPIDPAGYPEDWDVLIRKCIRATYRTSQEGVELKVKMTAIDTGGEDGVAVNAYAFYRRCRAMAIDNRIMLVKGDGSATKNAPMIRLTRVGNRSGKEEGDVQLFLLNPNLMKDTVATGLKRTEPGPGYYHFPDWLGQAFFDELESEVRKPNGTWMQVKKRNEAWDLCVYIRACCMRLSADKVQDWHAPDLPAWMMPLFKNSELVSRDKRQQLQAAPITVRSARRMAPPGHRSVARSKYIG
jgi:phage terminase large subunit GpA-like protein